jgi:hypothetical protein
MTTDALNAARRIIETGDALVASNAEIKAMARALLRMEEALREIRMTPSRPFPDAGAHSERAFADAVWRAWNTIQRIARAALAQEQYK